MDRPAIADTQIVFDPQWYVAPAGEGSMLQICHPEHGWLTFVIPAAERITLMSLLLQQILAGGLPQPQAPVAVVQSTDTVN